jgi:hypothetical protein
MSDCKSDKIGKNHLAGTAWNVQITASINNTSPVIQSVMTFHDDGTSHCQGSVDIGQIILPSGSLGEVWSGNWKKVEKRKYKFFLPTVLMALSVPKPNLTVRLRGDQSLTLSKDKNFFKATGTVYTYAITDLTMSSPTQLGTWTWTASRLEFQ